MQVTVSENHIQNGKRGKADECPIALAINTKADCFLASMNDSVITFLQNKRTYRATAPVEARYWMRSFDRSQSVKPFSFNLQPTLISEIYS